MSNKNLIQERFEKSFLTYDENASVQALMAKKMIFKIPYKNFDKIFEFGCGTGLLTKEIVRNIAFKNYTLLDITQKSKNYIDKILPDKTFIKADIDEFCPCEKYNLIISNATIQWSENPLLILKKMFKSLEKNGILAFTTFGCDNLLEIRNTFGHSLEYSSLQDLKSQFKEAEIIFLDEEKIELKFENPKEILKHIQKTGVNAVSERKISKSELKKFIEIEEKVYKNCLTYHPIYAIFKNIG